MPCDSWSTGGTASAARPSSTAKTIDRSVRRRGRPLPAEMVRLIAQMSLGTGRLAVIGGTVVDRRLPDAVHRRADRGAGLQPAVRDRRGGVDRVRVGVLQCSAGRAADRRYRPGRHHRRRRHRAAGRDADQRGDRRARGDGHPLGRLSGVDPGDRRSDRGHPAVLRRGADGVLRPPGSARPSSTGSRPASTTTTSTRF